jgi:hypothetical protein
VDEILLHGGVQPEILEVAGDDQLEPRTQAGPSPRHGATVVAEHGGRPESKAAAKQLDLKFAGISPRIGHETTVLTPRTSINEPAP